MLRWVHIAAASIALIAAAFALAAPKGSPRHRRAGLVFAAAMATMTGSAVLLAGFVHPNRGNVVAALVTFYLVATGFLTVRRDVAASRGWHIALMLLGLGAGLRALSLGMLAVRDGSIDHFPAAPFFLFALIAVSGALLDARLLMAGHIEGAQRLVRHLWRMGVASWIAFASFFFGQAKFFPSGIRESGVLAVPVLLVTGTVLYWLVRTLWRGRKAARVRAEVSAPSAGIQ